jgi:hypothetical protein
MMIPIHSSGVMKRALSPNALHAKLGTNLNAATSSPERDMLATGNYDRDDDTGQISSNAPAPFIPTAPKALELFDPFDPTGKDITVNKGDEVIPTGIELQGEAVIGQSLD